MPSKESVASTGESVASTGESVASTGESATTTTESAAASGESTASSGESATTTTESAPPTRQRDIVTFSDLATAAYCPRKLHYARQEDDRSPPERAAEARRLATRYPDLRVASDTALQTFDLAVPPDTFRRNLDRARAGLDRWQDLASPTETETVVTGKDCRGRIHKVLADPPIPVLVSPGQPPEQGVWAPQGVRVVAAAKALAWREEHPVDYALVEYPFHGVIRRVSMTTRRRAVYRRTLRTVRDLASPPARLHDDAKCGACEYSDTCGVQTRSLRSLL